MIKRILLSLTLLPMLCSLPVWAETLYSEQTFRSYVSDRRAYQPGDLLTVLVVENSSAATSADTSANRSTDLGLKLDVDDRIHHGVGLQTDNDFDARGRVQRSGRLLAQITVTVTAVRANGDLVVSGRQVLDINDEKQEIFITGVARPVDVDKSNAVVSSRLGEASIRYAGEGELADRQRPAWWNRFLSVLGW
ncbi:Flagellar L-ring protein [Andreprevotia sp. IGB-42]|uniref:flagellar basal body L-ring protein FlgH n=1 Tax=Andreprevotia sp. IGB-42 TaxID=2497473 RepID=UPI0013596FC7|nr:flagellar basal body L-ring protein FlgH [Andreprevotia sp. IGB-42]KAF0813401.1 Flagellar L-ring protein [Andreprevotia sp. IGB-42]